MKKNNKKFSYLDITICLLSVIFILLLVGVFTSPNNEKIMTDNSSSSIIVNNQNMSSLSEIEDEEELIEFLEDNNIDMDYLSEDLSNYYVVEFDSNGGTDIDAQIIEYGKTASRPTNPIKSCYIFNGWYLNGERFYFSSKIRDNITLEAKWTYNTECDKKDTYIVEFDSNGGSEVDYQVVIEGNKAIEPDIPQREGYKFNGWYLNGSKYYFNNIVRKDIVLEARWEEVEEYTVKFNSNGGTSVKKQYVYYGEYVEEPNEPERDGYEFIGWYLNGSKYNFNRKVTSNLVLEAKWNLIDEEEYWEDEYWRDEEFKVQFDSNGGTSVKTQYVEYGEYVTMPDTPTKSGYEFEGWYLDGMLYDFDEEVYEDIILEAKWDKETTRYYEYCKKETETHYSISYVGENSNISSYNWTIKFDDINAKNVKITDVEYLSTTTDYNNAYKYSYNKQISMVGNTGEYDVLIPSGSVLKNGSLKSHNFFKYLSTPYEENGVWYTEARVSIKDYYLANSYYANKLDSYIYMVPFKFEIEYVDLNNCEVDLASRSSFYRDYSIVDTFYQ